MVETTDALITTVPGIALVVLTADCVPVLLSDDEAGVVAAVHAGRMGARNGIVPHHPEDGGAGCDTQQYPRTVGRGGVGKEV